MINWGKKKMRIKIVLESYFILCETKALFWEFRLSLICKSVHYPKYSWSKENIILYGTVLGNR